MKLLSFIIPAYNSENFLDICIPSMLHPDLLEQLEIIVVNDGSTDSTPAVAQKYCHRYPDTVRLISQENKGHGGALNTGCACAQGKYLKVIDADDWVETANLPAFVAALEDCSSDVVLTHHRTLNVSTGETQLWRAYPETYGRVYTLSEIMEHQEDFARSLTFHGITYRTSFYQSQHFPLIEHVFYEDHQFAAFPCCLAESVLPLDLLIYNYRIGDAAQSVSDANQIRRLSHTEAVLNAMLQQYHACDFSHPSGGQYARMKLLVLLLSYLTTTLLLHPEKKTGLRLARDRMEACRNDLPALYDMAKRKYRVFRLMRQLNFRKKHWDSIKDSALYRMLRNKKGFE